jgi:hypothetical protein
MPRLKRETTQNQTEPVSPQVEIEAPVQALSGSESDDQILEVTHDIDDNTVFFSVNGISLTLREPIGKDFLLLDSWLNQAPDEYRDLGIVLVKLASLCAVGKKVPFDTLFDNLISLDDVERVGAAMSFFRDSIGAYLARRAKNINR